MKPRVMHVRNANSDLGVYIGRPSVWGNPYMVGRDGTREEVIEMFRVYLAGKPDLVAKARVELYGRNLVCFCAPKACHGDVLLKVANGL